jgi:allose kinase
MPVDWKPVLAMDIGGTHTRIGLVNNQAELSAYNRFPTQDWAADAPLERLYERISQFLEKESPDEPAALSIGFPSAVDKARRVLISTPAIPTLDGKPVVEFLEKHFSCPVYIDRDVVMIYSHAAHTLKIPAQGITLGFFIGTGIGNVIVINGQVFNGAHGIAGELGHVPVWGRYRKCGCGGRGCAELYTAGRALVTIRSRFFMDDSVDQLFVRHGESKPIESFLTGLSLVMSQEMIILDPDRVVLGSGVVHMKGFPVEKLTRMIADRLRSPEISKDIQWYVAPDAQHAGVFGAGMYAFDRLNKGEKSDES